MVTVLAVADTDSYLKWSVSTLARLRDARTVQVVLANPVAPSAAQRAAAGADGAPVLDRRELARLVDRLRPDAVLLACTGPVVAALLDASWARRRDRPVLVTGLPGISIPATSRALRLRAGCDLFLLHSHREVAEFHALAHAADLAVTFGLARLPFLADARAAAAGAGGHVVFAAQAKVPATRADREAVLRGLARADDVVVKLRAATGEQQTHHEHLPYPALYADLVGRGELAPGSLRFSAGPMGEALAGARGLVTVSSTAALEAVAAGVPVLLADDFGVSAEMINLVFAGSGCLLPLAALERDGFTSPEPAWLVENYFHPDADDDWQARLEALLRRRAAAPLPRPVRPGGRRTARLRRSLRLSPTVLRARRTAAALRRVLGRGRPAPGRRARAPHPDHPGS